MYCRDKSASTGGQQETAVVVGDWILWVVAFLCFLYTAWHLQKSACIAIDAKIGTDRELVNKVLDFQKTGLLA
jgi:hypothetical protein